MKCPNTGETMTVPVRKLKVLIFACLLIGVPSAFLLGKWTVWALLATGSAMLFIAVRLLREPKPENELSCSKTSCCHYLESDDNCG